MTRSEAIKILWQYDVNFEPHPAEDVMHAIDMAIEALEHEPKRGKLIAIDDTHDQCMECGAIFCITSSDEWEVNYCPNCGKGMESDTE